MSTFVDFETLKARVKIEQTIPLLGLRMRQHADQYRGPCPACKQGGERGLAINAAKQGYYCVSQRKGGDLIALCLRTTFTGGQPDQRQRALPTGSLSAAPIMRS